LFPDSVIDARLIQAFRETHYQIHGAEPLAAKALGRTLRQNAIVWSDADAVPRLILLR